MSHLLVTNDYPPKVGGIQNYLFELWRRLPPDEVRVLTRDYPGAAVFDRTAPHRIDRVGTHMLLPTRALRATVDAAADAMGAGLVVIDPVFPLSLLGPHLEHPYAVIVHGAELTVPARLLATRSYVDRGLASAALIVTGGDYPDREVRRLLGRRTPPVVSVPPGVDAERFHPLADDERAIRRRRLGIGEDALLVVAVSRLVPRKGMDVLIEAAALLHQEFPNLEVCIGGTGRDRRRLERLAAEKVAPVRFLGRVPDDDLPELIACADVGAMLCRARWLGLEQEGFGIVFLEGSASGVAQLAGGTGGAVEAVAHLKTGIVVDRPADTVPVTAALRQLLSDAELRARLGAAGRARMLAEFDYGDLARTLHDALVAHGG